MGRMLTSACLESRALTHRQDAAQAEALLGQLAMRSSMSSMPLHDLNLSQTSPNAVSLDESPSAHRSRTTTTPVFGTPIKLAPSTMAFRKGGSSEKVPVMQQRQGMSASGNLSASGSGPGLVPGQSPSRGMMGQMSDLIFGW
jgi:nuclear pore complex protein Nup53